VSSNFWCLLLLSAGEANGDPDRVNFILGDEVEEDSLSLESEDSTDKFSGKFHNGNFMDANSSTDRDSMEPTAWMERRQRLRLAFL